MWLWILAAQAADYVVEDIGTLGGSSAAASAINERGMIVGISSTSGPEQHAFLWRDGKMQDLGTLGGRHSFAWDVNDHGAVVGGSQDAAGRTHATKWEGGQVVDLGVLPGGEASFALAINERGQVTGFSQAGDGATHAVLWDGGKITDLGTVGGDFSFGIDVNRRGQVLAMSSSPVGHRAFVWKDGQRVEIAPPGALWSSAFDINDRGQVVGSAAMVDQGTILGYLWSPDGTFETFGLGGDVVVVAAVNEFGIAAGYGTLPGTPPGGIEAERPMPSFQLAQDVPETPDVPVHAFVYRDGAVRDLGTLGGKHASAVDINAKGEVVGASARADGVARAFVWADGVMTELKTPAGAEAGASDVNDRGEVVGSWSADGKRRAFVARPCRAGECGATPNTR